MTTISRRFFLGATAASGLNVVGSGCTSDVAGDMPGGGEDEPGVVHSTFAKRLTGADMPPNARWKLAGTDLGIPYVLPDGAIGFLFGDSFSTAFPEGPPVPNDWRSPVLLRSRSNPNSDRGIEFESAAGIAGDGMVPEIIRNGHNGNGIDNLFEVTVIPNDGVSFPESGRQVVSYMSVENWNNVGGAQWKSRYAGLAYSDNGNNFTRTNLKWWNNAQNSDPFQMWTMQRDGDYVYVFTVKSGRQKGPMLLMRVRWQQILEPGAYECWGSNGTQWAWGKAATPILEGSFGEPSVRKLQNGTWAMCYLDGAGSIVSRVARSPVGPWSGPRVQVTWQQEPGLYGGFIHPWSSTGGGQLHLLVSKWTREGERSTAYHVSQFKGTL